MQKTVVYNIKKIRLEKGLTLRQLAEKSGVSNGFISAIENNKQHPTLITLVPIADALEVDVNELFTICSL
ncbi:MAG: helix-turn-helix transcriptional regulator [bacterium]|nr:helix-turn-helix transcriptional regulator [bacterium]